MLDNTGGLQNEFYGSYQPAGKDWDFEAGKCPARGGPEATGACGACTAERSANRRSRPCPADKRVAVTFSAPAGGALLGKVTLMVLASKAMQGFIDLHAAGSLPADLFAPPLASAPIAVPPSVLNGRNNQVYTPVALNWYLPGPGPWALALRRADGPLGTLYWDAVRPAGSPAGTEGTAPAAAQGFTYLGFKQVNPPWVYDVDSIYKTFPSIFLTAAAAAPAPQ